MLLYLVEALSGGVYITNVVTGHLGYIYIEL